MRLALVLLAASSVGCGLVVSLDNLEGPGDASVSDGSVDAVSDGGDAYGGPSSCIACLAEGKRCCEHYRDAITCVAAGESCPADTTLFNWGCDRNLDCASGDRCCVVEDWMYDGGEREPRRSECAKAPCVWDDGTGDQWVLCLSAADCDPGQKCVGELRYVRTLVGATKEITFHRCVP